MQHLNARTLEYLNMKMPQGRLITGNFFGKLCALKFTPEDMTNMTLTVHGCLLANAVGQKERESVGTTITDQFIKSLMGPNRAKGLIAGSIIQRADEILRKKNITGRRAVELYGDISVQLVNRIFDVDESCPSLEAVSRHFIEGMLGVERAPASSGTKKPESASANGIVEHTTGSNSNVGRITLESVGFRTGMLVERKHIDKAIDEQWEICYVNDDGSVGLANIKADGTTDLESTKVVTMKLDDVVTKLKACKSRTVFIDCSFAYHCAYFAVYTCTILDSRVWGGLKDLNGSMLSSAWQF